MERTHFYRPGDKVKLISTESIDREDEVERVTPTGLIRLKDNSYSLFKPVDGIGTFRPVWGGTGIAYVIPKESS